MIIGKRSVLANDNITFIDDVSSKMSKKKISESIDLSQSLKLQDVLQHDELYSHYPELRYIDVKFNVHNKENISAFINSTSINLSINETEYILGLDNANYLKIKGSLLHEIQHFVQFIDKRPSGSSTLKWKEVSANVYKNNPLIIKDVLKSIEPMIGHEFMSESIFNKISASLEYLIDNKNELKAIEFGLFDDLNEELSNLKTNSLEQKKINRALAYLDYSFYILDPSEIEARMTGDYLKKESNHINPLVNPRLLSNSNDELGERVEESLIRIKLSGLRVYHQTKDLKSKLFKFIKDTTKNIVDATTDLISINKNSTEKNIASKIQSLPSITRKEVTKDSLEDFRLNNKLNDKKEKYYQL